MPVQGILFSFLAPLQISNDFSTASAPSPASSHYMLKILQVNSRVGDAVQGGKWK